MLRSKNRGFTVIELIVILGFLGMLLSLIVPKIDITPYYLLADARILRGDLRDIRYTTMTEGDASLRIVFDKHSYSIKQGSNIIKTVQLNPGIKINNNFKGNTISFMYNGSPSGAGGTASVIDEISKKYCEITVVPATGRIALKNTVFEGYKGK